MSSAVVIVPVIVTSITWLTSCWSHSNGTWRMLLPLYVDAN
jgi:hypothetical protein